jgi:CarD family transcriptional regulator
MPDRTDTSLTWEHPGTPDCEPGQQLFDPRHGVVVVEEVELRMVNGQPTEYLAVRTVEGNLRILVPLASADAALRPLMSADEATVVLAELGTDPKPTAVWSGQGFAEMQRRAVERSPLSVAGVVRDLSAKAAEARLRSVEQTLLSKGTDLLAAELSVALDLTRPETLDLIDEALEQGRRAAADS